MRKQGLAVKMCAYRTDNHGSIPTKFMAFSRLRALSGVPLIRVRLGLRPTE